jgi:hypothetical protein
MNRLSAFLILSVGGCSATNVTLSGDAGSDSGTVDASISIDAAADASQDAQDAATDGGSEGGIPSTLFGQHDHWDAKQIAVPYGTARIWDLKTKWEDLQTCNPNDTGCNPSTDWNWPVLDDVLATIHTWCPTCDAMWTFGEIASYANHCDSNGNPVPKSGTCPHQNNGCSDTRDWGCWLPDDLAYDGSGTNQYIKDYLTILTTHIKGLGPNYAHIVAWEIPWNELDRDPCIDGQNGYDASACANGDNQGNFSVYATYSQLQRIYQDAKATITSVIPDAIILAGNIAAWNRKAALRNLMYCDNASGSCGCPNGGCTSLAGHVDLLGWHEYLQNAGGQGEQIVEDVTNLHGELDGKDKTLPLWMTEGGWGDNKVLPDWDMQAGFIARYMIGCAASGVARCYWYRYDGGCGTTNPHYGTLYGPTNADCTGSSDLWWGGKAMQQVQTWLVGNTLEGCTNASLGVHTCEVRTADGHPTQIVWWAEPNSSTWCQGSTPTTHGTCDTTTYTFPTKYAHYDTLDPAQCPSGCSLTGTTVAISGQPIRLRD